MAKEFELKGLETVQARMRGLSSDLQKKGVRSALRKAANEIKKKAVENAARVNDPLTKEDISKNIAVRFNARQSRQTGDVVFRVGVLGGAKQYADNKKNVRTRRAGTSYKTDGDKGNPGGDTWYWRFLEFGTQKMQAQPILRPALINNTELAASTFVQELDRQITKALEK